MVKVLLCGSRGKMGAAVKAAVENRDDITVAAEVDIRVEEGEKNAFSSFDKVVGEYDCIIDFSHPSVLESMLSYAEKTNTAVVLCTTGLSDEQIKKVHDTAKNIPLFFSANMSLGVNLLVSLCKKAVEILGDDFDIEIIEKHHNQKIDAPSGTALLLANAMNEDGKYDYAYDRQSVRKKREKREMGIHSIRGGNIVGEHEVIFAGHDETVSLKHIATSKEVFATGAVNAAAFLKGKNAGLYSMQDMLK